MLQRAHAVTLLNHEKEYNANIHTPHTDRLTHLMSREESEPQRPTLQPSSLGKFIQLDSCSRYFDFRFTEDGFADIDHPESPHTFQEAFLEDNIIEKQRGNEFEETVFSSITDSVPTAIDIEQLTLDHVATALPDETATILSQSEWGSNTEATDSDTLSYYGIPADQIQLCEPDPVVDVAKQKDATETADNANHPVENELYRLRDTYTDHLFEYLTNNIDQVGCVTHAPFPVPTRKQPTSGTRRTRSPTDPVVVYQPSFSTTIGAWPVAGDADAVFIWPADTGSELHSSQPTIRVVDVKMTTEEQTHHQIQTVAYATAIAKLDGVQAGEVSIQGGVITRGDTYLPTTPDVIPQFNIQSRQGDLNRITQAGGILDSVSDTNPENSNYQLNSKCTNCQYNEVCYVDTVEKSGLELLGLGRGVQDRLENNGIHDLNDLAELAENASTTHALQSKPWDVDPRESLKPDVSRQNRDTYNRLAEIPGLGERLPTLIERAQILLADVNPQHRNVRGGLNKAQFITGSGRGSLPTDAFLDGHNQDHSQYKPGSLVRVYINVQHDHIREKIAGIGFHVTATASDTSGISWAQIDNTMSSDPTRSCQGELELLTEFATAVQDAIQSVAAGIDFSGYAQNEPFIHLFTFTQQEAQTLEETLSLYLTGAITDDPTVTDPTGDTQISHDEFDISPAIQQLRELLGMRGGASQQMVSAIAEDIESRIGVSTPTSGLVNIYSEFFPKFNSDERFERTDWAYSPADPTRAPEGETTINLQSVFRHRLFNSSLPCESTQSGIEFQIDGGPNWGATDTHTVRVRTGAQIPLAYLWSASDRITDEWVSKVREQGNNAIINPYRYHRNDDEYVQQIEPEDVEALLKRMCECTRHVEQGILVKSPIEVETQTPEETPDPSEIEMPTPGEKQ